MSSISIEIPREAIEQIAREVFEQMASRPVASREIGDDTRAEIRALQILSNKPYLNKQELALYFDCSERSIEEWSTRPADKNPLPTVRVGRDIRIKREKADEWMEREGERFWRLKNLKEAS